MKNAKMKEHMCMQPDKNLLFLQRSRNVIDQGNDLEIVHTIPKFPIHMTCTMENVEYDIFHDLTFQICKKTGVIQLASLVPLNRSEEHTSELQSQR